MTDFSASITISSANVVAPRFPVVSIPVWPGLLATVLVLLSPPLTVTPDIVFIFPVGLLLLLRSSELTFISPDIPTTYFSNKETVNPRFSWGKFLNLRYTKTSSIISLKHFQIPDWLYYYRAVQEVIGRGLTLHL